MSLGCGDVAGTGDPRKSCYVGRYSERQFRMVKELRDGGRKESRFLRCLCNGRERQGSHWRECRIKGGKQ